MPDERPSESTATTEAAPPEVTSPRPPADWGDLSRRLVRRTTDLIVIALIVIAGLTVARRVVVWWKTEPGDLAADPQAAFAADALAPWGIGPGGAVLEFGGADFALRRSTRRGTLDEATAALQAACRDVLHQLGRSDDLSNSLTSRPPDSRETQLLRDLAKVKPVERSPTGGWSLFRVPGPLPVVVGVAPAQPDADGARVVCWGLVMPLDAEAWNLWTIEPRQSISPRDVSPGLSVPPESRLVMNLSDALGGRLMTFMGDGPPEVWQAHFDGLAGDGRWEVLRPWRSDAGARSAAWIGTIAGSRQRIDVHLSRGERGWTGLISLAPQANRELRP